MSDIYRIVRACRRHCVGTTEGEDESCGESIEKKNCKDTEYYY